MGMFHADEPIFLITVTTKQAGTSREGIGHHKATAKEILDHIYLDVEGKHSRVTDIQPTDEFKQGVMR
jgi:hypothetical protein